MKQEIPLVLIMAILMVGLSAGIPLGAGATEENTTNEENVITERLDANALGFGLLGCCSTFLAGTGGGILILLMGPAAVIVSVVCFALFCLSLPPTLVLTPVALVLLAISLSLLLFWLFVVAFLFVTLSLLSLLLCANGCVPCLNLVFLLADVSAFIVAICWLVALIVPSLLVLCLLTVSLLLLAPAIFTLVMLTLGVCSLIFAVASPPCALLSCSGGFCCSPLMGTVAYLASRLWKEYGPQIRGLMNETGTQFGQLTETTAPVSG